MNTLPVFCIVSLYVTYVSCQDYNYAYYNNYDNGETDQNDRIMCYACHYHRIDKDTNQGDPSCDDPFQATGIAAVPCDGSCAKTLTHHGGGEYMVMRSCLANCRDTTDPGKTIRCCDETYCNGARSTSATFYGSAAILIFTALGRLLL